MIIKRSFDRTKFKAVAFDLDGTLLDSNGISSYTKRVIRQLSNRGIYVIISTGRGLAVIPDAIKQLPGVGYIVSSSGACVTDLLNGRVLSHTAIEKQPAIDMLQCIKRHKGVSYVVYPYKFIYTPRGIWLMKKKMKMPKRIDDKIKSCSRMTWNIERYVKEESAPIEKLNCFFNLEDDCNNALIELKKARSAEVLTTMGYDIEINALGVDKAFGLEFLCSYIDIALDEVVAFGDSQNDDAMLRSSGYSVVMDNADSELKKIADYIADDVANDGAARAACDLFDIKHENL